MPVQPDANALPLAVLTYDLDGTVTSANPAAAALLGNDDIAGSNATQSGWLITDAAGWPDPNNIHPALEAARTGRPHRGVIAHVTTHQGAERWLQVDATPQKNAAGDVEQVILTLTDVTQLLSDARLPRPGYGAGAVATVTDRIVAAKLDPQAILEEGVDALVKVRPGTWLATLINKDPRTMRVHAASDVEPQIAEFIKSMTRQTDASPPFSVTSRVVESGEPVLMPSVPLNDFMENLNVDTKAYLAANPPPPTQPTSHMGLVVVPMHARGSIVGALGLFERRSSNPLTQRDVVWIQEVADRMGLAADNAQLYVDAMSRLERLTALRSVQMAITAGPDLRLTLRVILDQAVQGLSIDAADVLLVDEADGLLSLVASTGFRSTSIPDYRLPVDEGMPGQSLQARRITTVTTLGAFSQFRRRSLFAREGFKAYGAVPLIVRGKLAGVLEVFHRSAIEPDREWLEFLDALAADAALAIDHASLQRSAGEARGAAGPKSASPALSSLDKEILGFVVEGLSNKAIAEKVHLSPHTVKFHLAQMLNRSGTANRTELARKATREGWI
ncbi:MAG TPA: GAF domain-containing protein [Candidatus Dormibacteraeota bacterium]|nr:GAF domain-containing protein [Candidatus Dormibacteraeota bacterium]